jgi:hypothetical protein
MMSSPWAEWLDRPGAFGLNQEWCRRRIIERLRNKRVALLVLYGCAFISSTRLNSAKTDADLFSIFYSAAA